MECLFFSRYTRCHYSEQKKFLHLLWSNQRTQVVRYRGLICMQIVHRCLLCVLHVYFMRKLSLDLQAKCTEGERDDTIHLIYTVPPSFLTWRIFSPGKLCLVSCFCVSHSQEVLRVQFCNFTVCNTGLFTKLDWRTMFSHCANMLDMQRACMGYPREFPELGMPFRHVPLFSKIFNILFCLFLSIFLFFTNFILSRRIMLSQGFRIGRADIRFKKKGWNFVSDNVFSLDEQGFHLIPT